MKLLTVYICIVSILLISSCSNSKKQEQQPDQPVEDTRVFEYGICIDSLEIERSTIRSGDNLSGIFMRMGFSPTRTDSICKTAANAINPAKLRAGMEYTTIAATQDSISNIQYVVFAKSHTDYAIIDLTGDSISAYTFSKPVSLRSEYIEGTITSSLWNTIKEQGGNPLLALKLSDIYAWQIDFFDVKVGDSFRILYDLACIDDTTVLDIANIRGAVFRHQDKDYYAIPFAQDSISEYFDEEGNSMRRTFLKAPMDFFRITSKFSNSRFHPVLKRYRAHHGVDYAAPVGTPVKTIGDGVVVAKAYQGGGAGHYLKIKHNAVYTTTYMHLSRYAKGIQTGSRVRQGEVIGYVGSSGLSTGPHLDFRVHKNGQPVNPLTMESPPALPVKAELKDSFNVVREIILMELDSLHLNYQEPAASIVNNIDSIGLE